MKRKAWLFSLIPIVALALVAFAVVHPLSAGASPAMSQASHYSHAMHTKQHPYAGLAGSNLIYHGGPVMGGTSLSYAIFWEPSGSFVSPTYNSLLSRYFGDVGSSSLYHNNVQYKDAQGNSASGAQFGGSWVDTSAYPSGGTISDAQVQQEVSRALKAKGWTSSSTHIFYVFTAKNENICINSQTCSFSTFCAYHSNFGSTIYAAMPYTGTLLQGCGVPTSPNHDIDADSTINVTSHEQIEAATDPLGNAWYDASGNEIGDKCAWKFGTRNSAGGDVTWNGNSYMVQKEWDNAKHRCVLAGP